MSALVWLTIPVGALLLALLWVAWATRTRPRADTHETVAAYRRFQAAFEGHRAEQATGATDPAGNRRPVPGPRRDGELAPHER